MNAKFEILVNQWITARFSIIRTYISKLRQVAECRLIFVNMAYTNLLQEIVTSIYVGDKRYNMNLPT